MLQKLKNLEKDKKHIRVGLVGCGFMGLGIAHQIAMTPGMSLAWCADIDLGVAQYVAKKSGCEISGADCLELIEQHPVDVLVEATNAIWDALKYCEAAIKSGAHVVMLNAEVDLAFGPYLKKLADEHGVVMTSDAGDQHGVLATMIEEIEMWGFKVVQAGNMKGFLNKHATIESLLGEAAKRNLNPIQCCSYTDGTKMSIEMALIANGFGYEPGVVGMRGPRMERVEEVMGAFDFSSHRDCGEVDYVLGAVPGGGVYVVGHCEDPVQIPYLSYYKLGDAPYYLFYRPYHLCHLETPRAVAKVALYGEALLQPWAGRVADTYGFAKRDLSAGDEVLHGIGDDLVYGQVAAAREARDWVPVTVLDSPGTVRIKHSVEKDQPVTWSDVEWEDRSMVDFFLSQ